MLREYRTRRQGEWRLLTASRSSWRLRLVAVGDAKAVRDAFGTSASVEWSGDARPAIGTRPLIDMTRRNRNLQRMENQNAMELVQSEIELTSGEQNESCELDLGSAGQMVRDLLDLELAPLGKSFTSMCGW
jgi:hypothetical protein